MHMRPRQLRARLSQLSGGCLFRPKCSCLLLARGRGLKSSIAYLPAWANGSCGAQQTWSLGSLLRAEAQHGLRREECGLSSPLRCQRRTRQSWTADSLHVTVTATWRVDQQPEHCQNGSFLSHLSRSLAEHHPQTWNSRAHAELEMCPWRARGGEGQSSSPDADSAGSGAPPGRCVQLWSCLRWPSVWTTCCCAGRWGDSAACTLSKTRSSKA